MDEQTEKFIESVKSEPILWDLSHPLYKNIKQKAVKWKMIGDEFGISYDVARTKWKNLRDIYARCLKKQVSGQAAEDTELSWKYSGTMEFLKEHLKPRKPIGNYSSYAVEELETQCHPPSTPNKDPDPMDIFTPDLESCGLDEAAWRISTPQQCSSAGSLASTSVSAPKRKQPSIEQSLLSTLECMQQYLKKPRGDIVTAAPSSPAVDAEDELYCRSLLAKLSTFPIELRNEAKIEMMRYLSSLQSQLLRSNKDFIRQITHIQRRH